MTVRAGLIAVVVGLLVGALTLAGQAILPEEWNRLANSGAIWVSVAFAVSSRSPSDRSALVLGTLTLLAALLGYQAAALAADASLGRAAALIWTGTALVGGPVFGVAGHRWHSGDERDRAVALALLGGVFVAEGAYTLLEVPTMTAIGWLEAAVGVAAVLLLGRSRHERLTALVLTVPLAVLGVLGYLALGMLFLL